ncbi:MAG TPA: hypothetical protein VK919_14190 [Solirubrobacterales bacterium]|nr:hypothetical protein [Solirubrobacterales bacterium]
MSAKTSREPTVTHHSDPARRVTGAGDDDVAGARGIGNEIAGTVHGSAQQAGREINNHWWSYVRLDLSYVIDELFRGRGFGRLLMIVGLLVALAGFGGWMYIIFQGFELSDPAQNPLDARVFGLPAPTVAFAAFFGGGVLASVGLGISGAARSRRERDHWPPARGF